MLSELIRSFLEGTCSIQILSDALHAPIFGCRIHIEDQRLVITPQVLFDELEDDLQLSNLEIVAYNGLDILTLAVKNHPFLQTLTIIKEKH